MTPPQEIGPNATAEEVAAMIVYITLAGRSCCLDNPITMERQMYNTENFGGINRCVAWHSNMGMWLQGPNPLYYDEPADEDEFAKSFK